MWVSQRPAQGHTFFFRGDVFVFKSPSQPHNNLYQTYIQLICDVYCFRNLKPFVKVPVKQERKKNKRRKRTRDDCQGSRVAKQQRLHSNTHRQHVNSAIDSSAGVIKECCDEKINNQTHTDSSAVTLETRSRDLPPKQTTQKNTRGFRDLLAQLRSNSSMIVRETR